MVPETNTQSPLTTAREYPICDSKVDPDEISLRMLSGYRRVRRHPGHPALGRRERLEAVLRVEPVGVGGGEHDAAQPERFEIVSQFDLPKQGEGPLWAHPVVCGGRLYVRHAQYLYAYDVRDPGP